MKKTISKKTESFDKLFHKLNPEIQDTAVNSFEKWKKDPHTVEFKPLNIADNEVYSAQVGRKHRALAKKITTPEGEHGYLWFWIGSHEDYNNVIKKVKSTAASIGQMNDRLRRGSNINNEDDKPKPNR